MKRKERKSRKYRGNRTQGYGCHKKHRGKGSQGGKGFGGSTKQKKVMMRKFYPEHFSNISKRGFTTIEKKEGKETVTVNVDELASIAKDKKEINLTEMGIDKLLGRGEAPKDVKVIVDKASAHAVEKIEKAGGKVIVNVRKEKETKKDKITPKKKDETKKDETTEDEDEQNDASSK